MQNIIFKINSVTDYKCKKISLHYYSSNKKNVNSSIIIIYNSNNVNVFPNLSIRITPIIMHSQYNLDAEK